MSKQIRFLPVFYLLASAAAIAFSAAQARAELYSIVNYPLDQGGHTISGTITTDGATGILHGSDIIGASISMDGAPFYSWTLQGGFYEWIPFFASAGSAQFTATSDGLYLPYGTSLSIYFNTGGDWSPTARISWNNPNNDTGLPLYFAGWTAYGDEIHLNSYWITQPQGQAGELGYGLPGGTWRIATAVPEPASASMLLGGLLGACTLALLRRRAAKR